MPNRPIDVLLIEDNAADARLLLESLKDAGAGKFNVHQVPRLGAALDYLADGRADVVLLDLSLPDSSGLQSVQQLWAASPSTPIVVLTGLQDEELALEAVRRGVQDYLVKGQCEGTLTAKSLRYAVERGRAEAAVRAAEAQLRTITDALPALISYVDKAGYYRLNNRAYETWFGVSRADVAGKHMRDVLGDGTWERIRPGFERALTGEEVRFEDRLPCIGGEARWVSGTYTAFRDPAGIVQGIVVLVNDVSDRKHAEEALRESEARLRTIVGTAVDAIVTIDGSGIIESVNPATEKMFGYRQAELLGRNVNVLMPEPYRGEHDGYLATYCQTGRAMIIGIGREVLGLKKDGSVFPIDLSVSEFSVGGRRMFTGIMHDISNRRRLEREIFEASTNEQRRIGHELHDGLCQQLTGISFATEILARQLKEKAPDVLPRVRKLADEVDQTITQARTLARGLNPVEVHADSLPSALDDLAHKVSENFGVSCRFRSAVDGDTAVRDNLTASHLYRIAQEAISNAIRHGEAKKIDVTLQAEAASLSLSVADDGKGFAADQRAGWVRKKHAGIGLQTMSYRARMINGILDIRQRPRRGVIVTCSVPRGAPSVSS